MDRLAAPHPATSAQASFFAVVPLNTQPLGATKISEVRACNGGMKVAGRRDEGCMLSKRAEDIKKEKNAKEIGAYLALLSGA